MLCDSNNRSCLLMAIIGSLVMGVAAGVVTGALSSSDNPRPVAGALSSSSDGP